MNYRDKKKLFNDGREPIAIIGIGCRYPGDADTPDAFWELLKNGVDAITEIPPDRWDANAMYHPDFNQRGKINVKEGGFISHIDEFDAQFFEIPPIEARRMDPQQRLLLEVTFRAVEDAGLKLEDLDGSKTGVFIGISSHDYGDITSTHTERVNIAGSSNTGNANSIAANRISYIFNFKGPSYAIDTACSSALNAAHLACQSIWAGESSMAVVGGVNIILKPELHMGFSKGGFLSNDCRCKTFDASADGYVRSEGAGVVLLKPLLRAMEDGDDIYACIIGTAVNQDGRTTGIPMPSLDSQIAMLKEAYHKIGIDPREVQYVEAHGTGTAIGDYTEGISMGTVLGSGRAEGDNCIIGSVKTNIGHLEPASGTAGLIKLALCIKHGQIPPNLHFVNPNPRIPFEKFHLKVPTSLLNWPKNGQLALAGINSFGFGGANVHLILTEAQKQDHILDKKAPEIKPPYVLVLSAKNKNALKQTVLDYISFIKNTEEKLIDICYSTAARRSGHDNRLSLVVSSKEEALEKLKSFLSDEDTPFVHTDRIDDKEERNVVFVYSGQGPQWYAMGRELLKTEPVFQKTIEEINDVLKKLGWLKKEKSTLLDELLRDEETSRINETEIAQPAIFALQVALTELWKFYGIKPAAVIGHSIGEVAAAYVSGALTLEEAARVVFWRSRCQAKAEETGKMLAVGLPEDRLREELLLFDKNYSSRISVAVINGPELVTLSGDSEPLEEFAERLKEKEVFTRFIRVSIPFHSHHMDSIKDDFLTNLGEIKTNTASIPMYSTVTKKQLKGTELTADYWYRNIREPVLFYPALKEIINNKYSIFIEVSPHPILSRSVVDTFTELKNNGLIVPSLRRLEAEKPYLLGSLGKLYNRGVEIDWLKFFGGRRKFIKLPLYPFQKEKFWIESEELKLKRKGINVHPHLLECRNSAKEPDIFIWDILLDKRMEAYIEDHRVQGPVIYPGAGHVELGISAALASFGNNFGFLEDINFHTALFLPDEGDPPKIQLEILSSDGSYLISSRQKTEEAAWSLHSNGKINYFGDKFNSKEITLSDARTRLIEEVNASELYKELVDHGLKLGPSFQGIRKIWRKGMEALGEIKVPEKIVPGFEQFNIHPAILDACFQTLFGVMYNRPGVKKWMGVYIPIHIDRVKFYQKPRGRTIWSYARLLDYSREKARGELWIFDEEENLCLEIKGFLCQYLEGSRGEVAGEENSWFYEYIWKMKSRAEEERQREPSQYILSPPLIKESMQECIREITLRPNYKAYFNEFEPEFDVLCIGYIIDALKRMGISLSLNKKLSVKKLIRSCGVIDRHFRLFNHLFVILKQYGYLKEEGHDWVVVKEPETLDVESKANELKQNNPFFIQEWTLLNRCGPFIKEVLRGEQDPIQLIFPENEWNAVVQYYMEGISFKIYNDMVQHAIPALLKNLPEEQTLKVLEVGAGTGGMTQAVLPLLPPDRSEYVFTDLSQMFMLKAQNRFNQYRFVDYQLLDIEKDPEEQGFKPHSYDIIIASDVVHATSDIKNTLKNIKKLMAPGALLIMLEVTKAPLYLDLIFGMTAGWWLFKDESLRKAHATLPKKEWMEILKEEGFKNILPATDVEKGDKSSQTVFFTQGPKFKLVEALKQKEESSRAGFWMIFTDNSGTGDTLEKKLKERHKKCIRVTAGKEFEKKSEDHFVINPASQDDMKEVIKSFLSLVQASESAFFEGVVQLWPLNSARDEQLTIEELERAQDLSCVATLNLVKEIMGLKVQPHLWLITSGVERINQRDKVINISQASLWGFGRVLINEYSPSTIHLIDLSEDISQKEIDNLFNEFWTEEREHEIALRGKTRYVHILDRVRPENAAKNAQVKVPGIGSHYHTEITEPGVIDNLIIRQKSPEPIGDDEVEIEVRAAALNFRDVMIAMGLLADEAIEGGLFGRRFGLECAGIISRVGNRVKDFKAGDEVVAMAVDSLGGYSVTNKHLVAPKPEHLTFQQAASIPIVYLTAYYSLNYLCRMKKGDRVLIHAGTGGVGIAAINLAQQAGAEVFATAGSEEKRNFLKKMGVKHIFNSRSLDFKDQILDVTKGRGVDIILNSISGKAILQNINCLAPFGRFVEIGKTDIYRNSQIGLKPFGDNLSYFAVDIDRMLKQKPEFAGKLFKELLGFFYNKSFEAHPCHIYPVDRIKEAFQFLSQSRQIGKVVISMENETISVSPPAKIKFKKNATYLIPGGCSGFGLAIARWMTERGAGNLVLMSRSGVKNDEDMSVIKGIEQKGVNTKIVRGDITSEEDIKGVIAEIKSGMPPLRGVIHSALVLEDATIMDMTREMFYKPVRPKINGAWLLHKATLDEELDFFLMFSSIASTYGSPGQCNYAAGNSFLDRFGLYRQARGLPGITVSWGVLGEVGFVARTGKIMNMLTSQGWGNFTLEQSLKILERALLQKPSHIMAAIVNWDEVGKFYPYNVKSVRFAHLHKEDGKAKDLEGSIKESLLKTDEGERFDMIYSQLADSVARILGTSGNKLDHETPLTKMGLDSLMANQIRNWIQGNLGFDYSLMRIMQGPSLNDLTKHLFDEFNQMAEKVEKKSDADLQDKNQDINRWIVREENPDAKLRLFCFSYLGAGASTFSLWKDVVPEEIELCAVQLPGREERMQELPIEDNKLLGEKLIEAVLACSEKPFAFYGHSFGAGVAFSLAHRLISEHNLKPVHIFIGAAPSPHVENPLGEMFESYRGKDGSAIPEELIINFLKRLEVPEKLVNNKDWLKERLPAIRADIKIMQKGDNAELGAINCPVTVFAAENDSVYSPDMVKAWEKYAGDGFDFKALTGGHMFHIEEEGKRVIFEYFKEKLLL